MATRTTQRFLAVGIGLMLIAGSGCLAISPQLQGSGVAVTETRSVGAFNEIEVAHAIQLDVQIGPTTSVEITTDDNLMPHVQSTVTRNRLKLTMDTNTSTKLGVRVTVTTPELTALSGSGATNTTVASLEAKRFRLDLSGASTAILSVAAQTLEADLSGASRCTLGGSAERLVVECSGASHFAASAFDAQAVEVEASGASTAEVRASHELTADASGASTILYGGSPAKVRKDESGASTVTPK
jgi:hypothetical protein